MEKDERIYNGIQKQKEKKKKSPSKKSSTLPAEKDSNLKEPTAILCLFIFEYFSIGRYQ